MRYGNKKWCALVSILALIGGVFVFAPQVAEAAQGLTITPATATLSLAKDEAEQKSALTVTNNYTVPVVLRFHFAAPEHATARGRQGLSALSVTNPEVTLAPNASFAQTVSLRASDKLSPGSQQAALVITQITAGNGAVGVLPELRLPLILVKEDGAISDLSLVAISSPNMAATTPKNVTVTLQNSGNMIAIPRGFVTVTAPNGTHVGKGVLNIASAALTPGARATYDVTLTPIGSALLPGPYRVAASYGLGRDSPAKTGYARFIFIAWWHVLVAIGLVATAYVMSHRVMPTYSKWRKRHPMPATLGRDKA